MLCPANYVAISNFSSLYYSAASFTALDRNYLTPFFTSNNGDDDEEGKFDYLKLCHFTKEFMKWMSTVTICIWPDSFI